MAKIKVCLFAWALVLLSVSTFAVDGVTLISQASVNAAGGFPYSITQSGSYKLSSNLTVTTETDAIDINADNVVLDLNGFTIASPCDTCARYGVFSSGHQNITIKNGVVTGFGYGIRLNSPSPIDGLDVNALVEEVHASNNQNGINIQGGIVRRCTATGNSSGITVNSGVVESNLSSNNLIGFNVSDVTLTGNSAKHNSSVGLGIGPGTVFGSNVVIDNQSDIVVVGGSISQNNNVCTGGTAC